MVGSYVKKSCSWVVFVEDEMPETYEIAIQSMAKICALNRLNRTFTVWDMVVSV